MVSKRLLILTIALTAMVIPFVQSQSISNHGNKFEQLAGERIAFTIPGLQTP